MNKQSGKNVKGDRKNKFKIIFLFCFMFILFFLNNSITLYSQRFKSFNITANQLKKYAESAVRAGDYYTALKFYMQYAAKKPDNSEISLIMADLYAANRDYQKAASNYLKAYHKDSEKNKKSLYYYAVMTKMQGNYSIAIDSLNKFIKIYREENDYKIFRKYANVEIKGCNLALQLINDERKKQIDIVLLDESINKAHVEMSPQYLNNESFIYASLKADKIEYFDLKDSANWPVRKFYYALREGNKWKTGGEFAGPFNLNGVNTCNGSFSPDGKRFYYNRCWKSITNKVNCSIYISCKINDEWQIPEKIPEPVNLTNYTSTQPTIGHSSRTNSEIIYFASDRPEGKGGMDIWYTIHDTVKNSYSNPKNLGRKINSERNEMTPFFDYEKNILYYSSDGKAGIGGFDIFKSENVQGKFLDAVNIGIPYNSSADDLYYVIHKNQHEGFLVSNRENDLNVKNETCCDDIYSFNSSANIRFLITGMVMEDKNNILSKYNYNQVLRISRSLENVRKEKPKKQSNVTVYLYSIDRYTMESFYFLTDTTDENGEFQFDLQSNKDFLLRINEYGVFSGEQVFHTYNYENVNIRLDTTYIIVPDKPYIIEDINFETDNTELTPQIEAELNSTLLWLLEEMPHIIIEISHQSLEKDPDLMQMRTQNIIDYLISKGISENRVYDNSYFVTMMLESETETNDNNQSIIRRDGIIEFNIIGKLILKEK